MPGYICTYPCYEYKGHTFEMTYSGPWPLKKDGTPRMYAGPIFWALWDEFEALTKEQQEAHRASDLAPWLIFHHAAVKFPLSKFARSLSKRKPRHS